MLQFHFQHNMCLSPLSSLHPSLVLITSHLFFNPHRPVAHRPDPPCFHRLRHAGFTLLLVISFCPHVVYMLFNVYVCVQMWPSGGAIGWYWCSCVVVHTCTLLFLVYFLFLSVPQTYLPLHTSHPVWHKTGSYVDQSVRTCNWLYTRCTHLRVKPNH